MESEARSGFGRAYDRVLARLCGRPLLYPWHFQWLAVADLYRDLRRILPALSGRLLDVGCGDKPYSPWLPNAREHIGIDVVPGPCVDVVVRAGESWPLDDESFDAVLCTQVLEHVVDLSHVVREIHRVLKPGATVVVSVPFAYNEHGAPHDYRRFSAHGLRLEFERDYEILEIKRQGGIASTSIVLALNWWDTMMDRSQPRRVMKALTLPAWVLLSGLVNALGLLLDKLDRTEAFYSNVLLLARKKATLTASSRR